MIEKIVLRPIQLKLRYILSENWISVLCKKNFPSITIHQQKFFRQINDIIYLLIGVATFFDDMAYNSLTLQIKISIKLRFIKDNFFPNVCKNNTKHNESCKWYVKRWIIYVAFVQKDSHCKISSKFLASIKGILS